MRKIDSFRLDKGTLSILSSFEETDAADKAYWHSKTPQARLEVVETSQIC